MTGSTGVSRAPGAVFGAKIVTAVDLRICDSIRWIGEKAGNHNINNDKESHATKRRAVCLAIVAFSSDIPYYQMSHMVSLPLTSKRLLC